MTGHAERGSFECETIKLRHGWRLRLWFRVDRLRTWWRLRKWTPEMREELKRVERAIDREIFFGSEAHGRDELPPVDQGKF